MSHPFVDTKSGLAMLGGNKTIYVMLIKKYFTGDLYEKAVEAVAEGDSVKAQTALHTLKGATGNLHLKALYEKSKELELGIKESGVMPANEGMADLAQIQMETMTEIQGIINNPDSI